MTGPEYNILLNCVVFLIRIAAQKEKLTCGQRSDIIAPGEASVLHVHFKLNFVLMNWAKV
jgi:hypothetical protein